MTNLYSRLARVYHEMYQSIFDYKKEFQTYDRILQKHGIRSVLEIGCGSGNLAPYFLNGKYDYTGIDLSREMIAIARSVEPRARFIQGDMRNLRMRTKYDAIIITGRSFTYMTRNEDVLKALGSIHDHLKPKGILAFDNFDAKGIFGDFRSNYVHKARFGPREYKRVSTSTKNLQTGWTWDWHATYYIKENGKTTVIQDKSVLRAFTQDELKIFLALGGFSVEKMTSHGSSVLTVAQKI